MVRKASSFIATVMAFHMLLLLPLAFAIHAQSHTHTVHDASQDQWYDDGASQCQLCADHAHQALAITSFTFVFIPDIGGGYSFFLSESTYTSSVDIRHVRGPPAHLFA